MPTSQPHLHYLDGIRGLAAFYVVLHHITLFLSDHTEAQQLSWWGPATSWLQMGHFAVVVFIVLSGYCLMIPVARSGNEQLAGGVLNYLKRRARRILPPYYVAVILSCLLIALVPGLRNGYHAYWDIHLPAFTPDVLISHILLIHNVSPNWSAKISGPFWSVATEWQIYFALPLLLLVKRRLNLLSMTVIAIVVGCLPQLILHKQIGQACYHFLGIFAMGAMGAAIGFGLRSEEVTFRTRVPWGIIAVVSWVIALVVRSASSHFSQSFILDFFVGIGTTSALIYCTRFLTGDRGNLPHPATLSFFESSILVKLGGFSYSLYLIHFVIIAALDWALMQTHVPFLISALLLFFVGTPIILGLSYLFYLGFEKPFLKAKKPNLSNQPSAVIGVVP